VNSCTYIGINTYTVGLVFIHCCADGNNELNKTVPHTDKVAVRIPNFKDLAAEHFSIKFRDQSNKCFPVIFRRVREIAKSDN